MPGLSLFQESDGRPLSFYIRPGKDKVELAPLILSQGGRLCKFQEPGAILLARPGELPASTRGDYVSTRYITDCLAQKKRLPLEGYRLEPQPSTSAAASGTGALQGRMPFTEAEDQAILSYVRRKKQAGQVGSIGGISFWKSLGKAQVTSHPWQATRDHYLKHLRPRVGLDVLAKTPKRDDPTGNPLGSSAASQNKTVAEVSRSTEQSGASGCSAIDGIFVMANKEFDDSEEEGEGLNPEEESVPKHTKPMTTEDVPENPTALSSDAKNPTVTLDPETPTLNPPAPETPAVIPPAHKTPADVSPAPEVPAVIPPATEMPVDVSPASETPADVSPAPETPAVVSPDPESLANVPLEIRQKVTEFLNSDESGASGSPLPVGKRTSRSHTNAVSRAVWDMLCLMKEFHVNLETVTQVFLKTSGDIEATVSCLRTGQRSDGRPLWTRQDDADLRQGDEGLRSKLVSKYGAENVEARIAFRKT